KIQRSVNSLPSAILGNRLADCEDVRFVKCALQRRAAVSRSSETHALLGIRRSGAEGIIRGDKPRWIYQCGRIDVDWWAGRFWHLRVSWISPSDWWRRRSPRW